MKVLALAALVAAGCSSASSLQLDFVAAGPPALHGFVARLTLHEGATNRERDWSMANVTLPASIVVYLPDAPATVDVTASGSDAQGNTWRGSGHYVGTIHSRVHQTLTLQSGALTDGGVADLASGHGPDLGDGGTRPGVWTQAASTGPSGRNSARMVYDSKRKVVVLFGGVATAGDVNDTWEWDGSQWTPRGSAHTPSPRHGCGMVFDEQHGVTLLFSGAVMGGGPTSDKAVWQWDGTDWTAITTNTGPAPRTSSMMVYDSARHVSVLYGGETSMTTESNETWEFDGVATWTKPTLQGAPAVSRHAYSMVYDAAHQRVVVYGGAGPVSTTWLYDGKSWTPRTLQASPPARRAAAMAYDSARGVIVLFGGNIGGSSGMRVTVGDTWEWDGVATSWSEVATVGPPARASAPAVYDVARARVVLFGGNVDGTTGGPPTNPLADTWVR